MKWVYVFLFVILMQIKVPIVGASISLHQETIYQGENGEYLPIRYIRYNPNGYTLVDSHVFPMATLGTGGSFENLGAAWITQTLEYQGYLVAAYSIFDRGQWSKINILDNLYKDVYWAAAQDNLFFIGVTDTETILRYIPLGAQGLQFTLDKPSSGHQIYLTTEEIRIFMYSNGTDPLNYVLAGIGLQGKEAEDIQIDSFPGFGGLFLLDNGSLEIQSPLFNRIGPPEFTENSLLGHSLLSPTIFDPSIGKGWVADINQIFDLPVNSVDVYQVGFASSLVRTENNTLYELDDGFNWIEKGKFDEKYQPFDFSIIDVDLYLGTIYDNGIYLLAAGADGDQDLVPDILEGYYYSSSNTPDTDGDTIPDNVEIAFNTDPARDDRDEDKDGDYATNIEEYNSVLGDMQLDPNQKDSDFGGALDGWELHYQYNPYNNSDDLNDDDNDGVTNDVESIANSSPYSKDTDGDGMPDGWEIQYMPYIKPTNARDANFDYDSDGRTNLQEYLDGTDPLIPDPPPLYDQLLLVFATFCIVAIPIVYQILEKKLGDV